MAQKLTHAAHYSTEVAHYSTEVAQKSQCFGSPKFQGCENQSDQLEQQNAGGVE